MLWMHSNRELRILIVENNQPEKDLVHSEMLDSINWSKDDYLNLTLDDEVSILQDFKGKLFSLGYGGHAWINSDSLPMNCDKTFFEIFYFLSQIIIWKMLINTISPLQLEDWNLTGVTPTLYNP